MFLIRILINTCAYDAPLQVMIVAALDFKNVKILFNTLRCTNPAIDFVTYVIKKGTAHCYQKRAIILNNIMSEIDTNIKDQKKKKFKK